jgi:hypothetical protein
MTSDAQLAQKWFVMGGDGVFQIILTDFEISYALYEDRCYTVSGIEQLYRRQGIYLPTNSVYEM